MLQKGDVYIADGFGKVADGTLIGDNLGNAIYAKTGTGVVFDAGARDLDGLQADRGVQRLRPRLGPVVPEEHGPLLDQPADPDRPVTVLPGDVILARREGVIVIPPTWPRRSWSPPRSSRSRTSSATSGCGQGVYTPGQIDVPWTDADQGRLLQVAPRPHRKPPIPDAEIEKHL